MFFVELSRKIETHVYVEEYEQNLHEWMLSVIALKFRIPMHEVGKWKFHEVLRNFKAIKYEIEKIKETQDDGQRD